MKEKIAALKLLTHLFLRIKKVLEITYSNIDHSSIATLTLVQISKMLSRDGEMEIK